MEKTLASLFVLILFYGLFNTYKAKKSPPKSKSDIPCQVCQRETKNIQKELDELNSTTYIKNYIIDVINNGSKSLHFKGGVMEGGYASSEDAPKIADFVLSLAQPYSYSNDAQMFYTSICGGCHGDDGKGLGGTYPDLTKKRLLGITQKEEFLKQKIKNSQH